MNDTIAPQPVSQGASDAKRQILIVEDEEALAKGYVRTLSRGGFAVQHAPNGAVATELLMKNEYDVVLSDIHVPGASGVDILRTIRAYSLDVPMILMTGDPSLETAIEAVELGAMKYLVKPIQSAQLVSEVSRAADLHRLARLKRDALKLSGDASGPGDLAGLSARFDRALDCLWMAFQPIIDLETDRLFAYEALMRSDEPSLKSPLDVLDAAERLDRLLDMGSRVRERACSSFAKVKDPTIALFLNLHPRELLDAALYDANGPLIPIADRVALEVTERSALGGLHDVKARTSVLRFHGFRLVVDDLGAGYAGLTSFVTLEPEIVKLDMSLIRDIDQSVAKQRIVGSVAALARDMGMKVVAEGIETKQELDVVKKLACHFGQGYFLGKPARLPG